MKALLILAAVAAIASPAAAEVRVAQYGPVVLQSTVDYSDLDLSRTAGADALISRLRKATMKVCGGRPNPADMDNFRHYRDCAARSMDAAVRQINSPLLTARYAREPSQAMIATK